MPLPWQKIFEAKIPSRTFPAVPGVVDSVDRGLQQRRPHGHVRAERRAVAPLRSRAGQRRRTSSRSCRRHQGLQVRHGGNDHVQRWTGTSRRAAGTGPDEDRDRREWQASQTSRPSRWIRRIRTCAACRPPPRLQPSIPVMQIGYDAGDAAVDTGHPDQAGTDRSERVQRGLPAGRFDQRDHRARRAPASGRATSRHGRHC